MTETDTTPSPGEGLLQAITSFAAPGGNAGTRIVKAGEVVEATDPIVSGRENAFRPYSPGVTTTLANSLDPSLATTAVDAEITGGRGPDRIIPDRPSARARVKKWAEYVASYDHEAAPGFDQLLELDKDALVALADALEAGSGVEELLATGAGEGGGTD